MIPANSLVAQLQAYFKTADQPLIQLVDPIQELQPLFTVGEQVRAQVTNQLPTGRFTVLVKEQLLDLNLPRNTEPGQTLEMRVVANSPRLTFLLQQPAAQAANVPNAPLQEGSAAVDLSHTARFLGELMTERTEAHSLSSNQTLPLSILAENGQLNTVKLADALKQALTETGVFYESHLADWAEGKRSTESILREPPSGWLAGTKSPSGMPVALKADDGAIARQLRPDQQTGDAASLKDGADTENQVLSLLGGNRASELDAMPPGARQLIQQQLQVLDQRQLVWNGQAWPGQALRWEVEEEGERRGSGDPTSQGVWRTRLQLHLPQLGTVDILISLHDQKCIDVGFRVSETGTAERIRQAQNRLASQLDAAGLELTANQVSVIVAKGDAGE